MSAKTTSNPNDKGWVGKHPRSKPVQWKPVKTKCDKCVKITEQYNATMQALLNHRYWVHFWRQVQKNREAGKKDPFWPGKGDINEFEGKAIGANLALIENQNAQLELHKQGVVAMQKQAIYLRKAIIECELTACKVKKPSKIKKIKLGDDFSNDDVTPDINAALKRHGVDWRGPYSTRCRPCVDYVTQLNAVPGWVIRADWQLQQAERMLQYAKLIDASNKISLDFLKYTHPDKSDYSDLANQVAKLKADIASLKRLFETLLAQLQACEKKFCVATTEDSENQVAVGIEPISTCPTPPAHTQVSVGANNEVGSSANFKEKAKKKAAGIATKAIGSLLGIGGGSGKKAEGPGTYKDPVKNKHKIKVRNKAEKRELRVGGLFTSDGLLISSDIKKAPGKGTFQTVYLENARGWRLIPVRHWMYEIWRDWKLSVSWTRDTYVDGELVKHEEGGWSEAWRELIASGEGTDYAEVMDTPIWQQLGFNTAVSGARSLGSLFPITPEMLVSEPMNLVVHVTDPKKDPVVTIPYIFLISLDDKSRVVLTEQEQTHAATGTPCTNPPSNPVTTNTTDNAATTATDAPARLTTPMCPEGWHCIDGQQCPPIGNCTITISDEPQVGSNIDDNSGTNGELEDIEEIEVTGARLRNTPPPQPVSTEAGTVSTSNTDLDGLEEIEVTGTRRSNQTPTPEMSPEPAVPESTPQTKPPVSIDLSELSSSGLTLGGTRLRYGLGRYKRTDWDAELKIDLNYDPTIYGEEIDEPTVVGIVLKYFDGYWVPRFGNHTFISAKMYVPHPSRANTWVPHNSVKRKMTISFVSRSNEKGKAMNADLDQGPQDSPDLYFAPSRNSMADCRDDPTGQGHFGTCTTKFDENQFQFAINSDDYGGFGRLDVTCDGCVSLTPVAGLYPESFKRYQRWEVAVAEPDQAKRAVSVPLDVNRNQISDGYFPDKTKSPTASSDLENSPVGNGNKGDGLSAYQEYRGFINRFGRHQRTDWDKKTLLIENVDAVSTFLFSSASQLDVVEIDKTGHKGRIINFNSGHAHNVDQHGLLLQVNESLSDSLAGLCDCDLERPKGAERVMVKPAYRNRPTVAHELGHAVGMQHHGDHIWPFIKHPIRAMTGGATDLLPGKVHSSPMLCGKTLPAWFYVGTKGDQASGHDLCIMRYDRSGYVYQQAAGDFDCMPATRRTLFDDTAKGTGPNGFNRTAGDASRGNCMSQLWISSE